MLKKKKKKPGNIYWTWYLDLLQSQCSLLEMTTLTKSHSEHIYIFGFAVLQVSIKEEGQKHLQLSGWVPSVSSADTPAQWCRLKFTAAFLNAPLIKRSPTAQADENKSESKLDDVLFNLWPRFCSNDCVFSDSVRGSGVFLTVSSSRSLSSPLHLLWMKALALLDLDILILASLAFWVWEEKGQCIKQGGFELTEDD